jgi:hypothetical protein
MSAPLTLAAYITVAGIVTLLLWATWVVLNLWIWQKTKATGNLLMLIGSAVMTFDVLLGMFEQYTTYWLNILALGTLTVGFFYSVRPMVEAHLAKLKEKIHHATASGKGGGGSAS